MNSADVSARRASLRSPSLSPATRFSTTSENSCPITAARWSNVFSRSCRRSMRAASTAWTVAGIDLVDGLHEPVVALAAGESAAPGQALDDLLDVERIPAGALLDQLG